MPLAATTVVCYDSNLSMLSVTLDDHTQIFFVIVTMNRLIRVRVALEDRVKRAHFCFLKSAAALIRFFFSVAFSEGVENTGRSGRSCSHEHVLAGEDAVNTWQVKGRHVHQRLEKPVG
jgi:hypothetical protein